MVKTNENILKESKSLALDLETLNTQYKNLLIQYQQAVLNYVSYLKQDISGNTLSNEMVQIQGNVYMGTESLSQNNSPTLTECQASCANNQKCSGATFNGTKYTQPMCFLRSGDGDIINGSPSDYAIVPKGKQLLLIVQNINSQLKDTNTKIQEKTMKGKEVYDNLNTNKQVSNADLKNQYSQLVEERKKIDGLLLEYKTIDKVESEGEMNVSKNYYAYILLCIIGILIIYFLYKSFTPNTPVTQYNEYNLQRGGKNFLNIFF
jgi:hypothetical protein